MLPAVLLSGFQSAVLLSGFLLAVSIGLIVWHIRCWYAATRRGLTGSELDFVWRQFRRRMQASVMVAMLSVLIFVGAFIENAGVPLGLTVVGILILTIWVVLLALADMVATRQYYGRIQSKDLVEKAKLQAELWHLKKKESGDNGQPHNGNGSTF